MPCRKLRCAPSPLPWGPDITCSDSCAALTVADIFDGGLHAFDQQDGQVNDRPFYYLNASGHGAYYLYYHFHRWYIGRTINSATSSLYTETDTALSPLNITASWNKVAWCRRHGQHGHGGHAAKCETQGKVKITCVGHSRFGKYSLLPVSCYMWP